MYTLGLREMRTASAESTLNTLNGIVADIDDTDSYRNGECQQQDFSEH